MQMNEAQAIRLCLRHRDPVGFEYLVKKYRREAYYHAYALMRNREDAADACQESFQRAFMAIPKLVSLDRFYPWFYRILRNCCLNMLSRRRTILNHARETGSDIREEGTFDDPSSILEKKEEAQTVWRVLSDLDMDSREILSLKYIQGNSYEEIAQVLDIPRGTVMSRLFHARKAFREKYLHISNPECSRANGRRYE
jgi:RNA polymerase sigma-70 factor (ECF subfamily)